MTHPSPMQVAGYLERLAKKLRRSGGLALDRAELLAARGYPVSVNGSGARSSDTTSSTERAVGLAGDDGNLSPPNHEWIGIYDRIGRELRDLWKAGLNLEGDIDNVLAQDTDADQLPPGTGYCVCRCEKYCSPRQNGPEDRLKSGLAPNCHRRYLRWKDDTGNPTASVTDYCTAVRRARERITEEQKRIAELRAELRR